jgi:hypothetical protein
MLRIIALSFVTTTFAWTGAIHYEIMMNAYNQATPSARRFLRHHLGDDVQGIAEAAKWADSEDARVRNFILVTHRIEIAPNLYWNATAGLMGPENVS